MNHPKSTEIGLADENEFSESLIELEPADTSDATGIRLADDNRAGSEAKPEADVPDTVQAWIGRRLGHFKLLRLLGEGGMGMVIQALDTNLDRIVALKVLRKRIKGVEDTVGVQQFLREARAAAKLEHPNAAQIYEINEHKGWWYIASEMIEGGTLDQVVKATGMLPPAAACPLIADAASLLAVAHRMNIIHRDIKPHNLMLTRDGRCKVVDFGLVRWEDPNDPFDFTQRAVGTPHYLPPEASRGHEPSGAYDIYSLGATLYYALTGQPPFKGEDLKEVVEKHRHEPRPDPRSINPECSERLAMLVQRCMAIDPEERPSAANLASALRLENIGAGVDPASLVVDPATITPGTGYPSGMTGLSGALNTTGQKTRLLRTSRGTLLLDQSQTPLWVWVTRIAAASVVLGIVAGGSKWALDSYHRSRSNVSALSAEAFMQRFPEAPETYGTWPAETITPATEPIQPPAFSWVGRVDPDGRLYVANRLGQTAYPLDNPLAALIPADHAEFYADAQAARAAGKQPAQSSK